ncbi:MAG: DNA recombination protein RmuC [Candidatus Acidiferrales bacterium]
MTTLSILIAAIALIAGIAAGWLIAQARASRPYETQLRQLDAAKAAAESAASEVRKQHEALRIEVSQARERIGQESNLRAAAEASLAKTEENLREQRALLDGAQARLSDAFRSLAGEALTESTNQFLKLAESRLETLQVDATSQLNNKKIEIDGIVHPLNETLKELKSELNRVESSRQEAYGQLTTQVLALNDANRQLRDETGSLVNSLRQPQIKGKWGELTLRRAVELAGLSPHCDFHEQHRLDTEDGVLRPDLVIHVAGGKHIVVDSKVPLHAFLSVVSAQNEEERLYAMKSHVDLVRKHIKDLASKTYWSQFDQTPELVVLFMPAEAFFSAALEQDRDLMEDAMQQRVILASPTTLIALLKSVAYGWRQDDVSRNAEKISDLGKQLHDRVVKFLEHMDSIRTGLEAANGAYNRAVGALESRVLPSVRRFKELGVQAAEEIEAAEPTETSLRSLPSTTAVDRDD